MALHLIWSPHAQQDLQAIVAYIRRDNPVAAERFALGLIEQVEMLGKFPQMGRVVPERNDPAVREIIYRHCYRIVYRWLSTKNSIEIIRVWHAFRGAPDFKDLA